MSLLKYFQKASNYRNYRLRKSPLAGMISPGENRFGKEENIFDKLARQMENLTEKLQSPNANTRYKACGYLRVAPWITPGAVKALQNALDDPKADVAEADVPLDFQR